MSARPPLAVLLAALVLAGPPAARGQSSGEDSVATTGAGPFADDLREGGEPSPEREELELADALLGRAELADLADLAASGPSAATPAGRGDARSRGSPAWRLSWQGGGAGGVPAAIGRLEGRQGPARFLIRRREAATGETVWGGGVALQAGRGRLAGGTLGCAHGLGLLASGAGRAAAPTAASPLAPTAAGVRLLAAGDAENSLRGLSLAIGAGPWGLTGATGTLPAEADDASGGEGRRLRLARIACTGARGEAALLVCAGGGGSGASLAVTGRGADAWFAGEAAAWRAGGGGAAGLAWAAAAGLRRRGWLMEAQAAAADAGRAPPLGRPPPCLGGWAGGGWCVRAATAVGPRARLQALLAGSREREEVDDDGVTTRVRRRGELALELGAHRGWTLDLRLRRTAWTRSGWRDRSPWLPPATLEGEERTQAVATADGALAGWQVRLAARQLAVAPTGADAQAGLPLARGLAEARAERALGAGWSLRFAWAGAWGGAADLASCAAPAPGLAVPRRWGNWAGERSVGCARAGRRLALAVGLCLRRPAGPDLPARCEIWQRATLRW